MGKRSRVIAAGGIAVGAALLLVDRFARRRKQVVTLNQEMAAPASAVIDLIKQVEREKEFIPLVSSVRVLERTNSEVRYIVRLRPPLPGAVRYGKWWIENPPAVYWRSEGGTMGFQHRGEIHFTERGGSCTIHLRSEHWMTAPLAGRLAGPAVTPIIRAQLEAWLKHLADELLRKGG